MAPLRPANLNKRRISATGGNGGVIGPTKTPYVSLELGCRCCGGLSSGRFTLSESYCGAKFAEIVDFKGFFICCGPSTTKWFVAPSCTEVSRNWYTRGDAVTVANSCMGSCGWFVPECGQLQNPGYSCRNFWDSYVSASYWSNTDFNGITRSWSVSLVDGTASNYSLQNSVCCIRAFRCTTT